MTGPSKPLAILTLDGGIVQGASTLLALNKVLEEIAQENGVPRAEKPRPCDVFDTIAGIGAGGWLAILLGRFRMDIASCLSEWINLIEQITPPPQEPIRRLRLRLFHHCNFDRTNLVQHIDKMAEFYDRGDRLFEPNPENARTRHVFAAALASDDKGYNLFRSYEIPESARVAGKLLEGPENPTSFKISRAFEMTGTRTYLTDPYKEISAINKKASVRDTEVFEPHNITELALDEMWGIYGTNIPLSVVLNVGPGPPNEVDLRQIARSISWKLSPSSDSEAETLKRAGSPLISQPESEDVEGHLKRLSIHSHYGTDDQNVISEHVTESGQRRSVVARTHLFGALKAKWVHARLKRSEDEIEKDIKEKLENNKPGNANLYYRISANLASTIIGRPENP